MSTGFTTRHSIYKTYLLEIISFQQEARKGPLPTKKHKIIDMYRDNLGEYFET
jgi:hypothetical protein